MYCNYSKDKFGKELTFILPSWYINKEATSDGIFVNSTIAETIFQTSLNEVEHHYLRLLDLGWTPQQARQVLPNALKAELNMCGFVDDWKHFFKLRTAPNAHPDMVVLAKQLEQLFNEQDLWKNSMC